MEIEIGGPQRPLISDKQIYDKMITATGKTSIPAYKECKHCGKFSKPSNKKYLCYYDLHCRACGKAFGVKNA